MTISIITVSFNAKSTIADTLDSIDLQTFSPIEHIVVDGLSDDGTMDIVKSYPHFRKIISEPDNGIYDAMNKGIAMATGDIIGILNADDVYADNGIIDMVMERFQADETLQAVYGDLVFVDRFHTDKIRRTWVAGKYTLNSFYRGWMPPHPTLFLRRSVYEKYGCFNTSFKTAADYELMLRLLFKNQIKTGYINRVLVKMRMGGQSNASLKNRIRANREDLQAWKSNGLKPHLFTLILKPLRKITQFI